LAREIEGNGKEQALPFLHQVLESRHAAFFHYSIYTEKIL
jgi:hypothetical protein